MHEQRIFEGALNLDAGARRSYLDEVCRDDDLLRQRIETLLRAHDQPHGYLEKPAQEILGGVFSPLSGENVGDWVGPYKLIELLGEGGFGVVYKAEQTDPLRRSVALKVIKPGMDTRAVIGRFNAEKQALALMSHPHVAKVLDGGETDSGRSYFVMELVDGVPITSYCDDHKLTISDRLNLFGAVCRAVHHAHQKGIIHRDLKPANIMVTMQDDRPIPKVIDFGISKALHQPHGERVTSATQGLIGTPVYMSPEQARMDQTDVDTRSDVYSLGGVLYELLVGTTPFDKERLKAVSIDEMCRIIREKEPLSPSSRMETLNEELLPTIADHRSADPRILRQSLVGELDWIVAKSLEKDRGRRYESAHAFASDIDRFLASEPVEASPPSATYRFKKFAQRNTAALSAITTVVVVLLFATIFSSWLSVLAHSAERQAKVESLIQQIQGLNLALRRDGWFLEAWAKVNEASREGANPQLRDEATTLLAGLDARMVKQIPGSASALVFNPTGDRLLIGGFGNTHTRIWEGGLSTPIMSKMPGPGPVAFLNGVGVHLAYSGRDEYQLWDFAGKRIGSFRLPNGTSPIVDEDGNHSIDISPNGQSVVIAIVGGLGNKRVVVGSLTENKVMFESNLNATAFAFTPDASHIAIGTETGEVVVMDMMGQAVVSLGARDLPIHGLAFGRNPVSSGQDAKNRWRLAAGDAGGTVVVWDLARRLPISFCRGSLHSASEVAFSPDGTTIASSGRYTVSLWNAATGVPLLRVGYANTVTDLEFTPDGSRLAVSSISASGQVGKVTVWELEFNRGIRRLRGLSGAAGRVAWSDSGRYLACLANDWRIAVWDLAQGHQLLHVFPVKPGVTTDNSALAFSLDDSRLAFSSGRRLYIWNVNEGSTERTVELPHGLQDTLAFTEDGLLLCRFELENGSRLPIVSVAPPSQHPRVCVIRNILSDNPMQPVGLIDDFDFHVKLIEADRRGRYFVIEGSAGLKGQQRILQAYAPDGKQLWNEPIEVDRSASPRIDPTGQVICITVGNKTTVLDARTGGNLYFPKIDPHALSPNGAYHCRVSSYSRPRETRGFSLYAKDGYLPLVSLGKNDLAHPSAVPSFSLDGTKLAWGNLDGSVFICDLNVINERLTSVGMGW